MMREYSDYAGMGREVQFSHRDRMAAVDLILKKESEPRPQIEDFSDIYSLEGIAVDTKRLSDAKARFEDDLKKLSPLERTKTAEGKKMSDALEIITNEQAELSEWFGGEAILVRTTEYDDVFNGVDVVTEFDLGQEKDPERIALAVDVSRSETPGKIDDKIKRNTQKVMGGRDGFDPAEVKYFRSQVDQNFAGRLEAVVPVVVGIDSENLDKLIGLYADILSLEKRLPETAIVEPEKVESKRKEIKDKKDQLVRHPVQKVFLGEMKMQLEMYSRLLEDRVLDKAHAVYRDKVRSALEVVKGILDSKTDISVESMQSDEVFALIKEITQRSSRW